MTATITDVAARRGARIARANGIDIAYREVGDGPPLVLLSGALASTGPAWAGSPVAHVDHLDVLGEHFRVIAPDTRGSGATVHSGGAAGFDELVDDVLGLIEVLGLDRPSIAGFSEGGGTATLLALRHPDSISALVNHSGFDYFDPGAMARQTLGVIFGGGPDATQADPDAAEQMFQNMGPKAAETFATMKADFDDAQGDGHWRAYLGQFFDRSSAPLSHGLDDLGAIEVPALILTGDRDPFCPVELACTAYRSLGNGELGIVPNAEHEITPAIVSTMIDFLTRHAAGSR